ncbi:MAG TPA: hypothetical protein VH328_04690 [Burkholderiaceae bacterium]|nr:hypothetical protein [Burkholderiaceae bacterium]
MKQVVQSLLTAIRRSSQVRAPVSSAQAQETGMKELSANELRLIVGGGPKGSWSDPGL